MDNLTHTLTGVLLGRAGLKKLTGRATAALVISANLPDIDGWIAPLVGVQPMVAHRGFTHGIGGIVTLPFVTAALVLLWNRWRPSTQSVRFWPLLLVAFVGGLSHSLMDWLTSYGTRLLEPFSYQWFYSDAWFIIDPWVWIAIIIGLELSWQAERLGRDWTRPARISLAVVTAYAFLNVGISQAAVGAAQSKLAAEQPTLIVANPQPLEFWSRRVLWRNGQVHGDGWWDPVNGVRLNVGVAPNNLGDPRLAAALRTNPRVRAFLFWSRMPIVVEQDGHGLLADQRFSNVRGWSLAVSLD